MYHKVVTMHHLLITLVIVTELLVGISCEIICRNTHKCACLPTENEIEFQCPPDTFNAITHVKDGRRIEIDCYDNNDFDINNVPDLTLDDNKNNVLRFRFCQIPSDFVSILKKFSIKKLSALVLSESNLLNVTLTKEHFRGVGNLTHLDLSANLLINIDEDAFSNLTQLTWLILNHNKIKFKPNLFDRLSNLKVLELAGNHLNNLPDNLFSSLTNLERLHLWNNNLKNIKGDAFANLTNLRSLELSRNKIFKISENAFGNLVNLLGVNLAKNKLHNLSENLFKNNKALRLVRMSNNPHLVLPDRLFSNLEHLREVILDDCNLETIPESVFKNSPNLAKLSLNNNRLRVLSGDFFKNLKRLEELYLDSNSIENITNFPNLRVLRVKDNLVTNIGEFDFSHMKKLEILDLEGNKIKHIHHEAFSDNEELSEIYLAHNEYLPTPNGILLEDAANLKIVNFSYNKIINIEDVIDVTNKFKLEELDLSYNNISDIQISQLQAVGENEIEIHLEYNNIKIVDIGEIDKIDVFAYGSVQTSVIYLRGNPIECTCNNYDLWKYYNKLMSVDVLVLFNIITDHVYCDSYPYEFKELPSKYLTCELNEDNLKNISCPDGCLCKYRDFDMALIVECQDANLTEIPAITGIWYEIELHLENNRIETVSPPVNSTSYDMIRRLHLSNNLITTITRLPINLEVLALENNKLNRLEYSVLKQLNKTNVKNLTLHGNPWICDCNIANLTDFLHQLRSIQVPTEDIRCVNSGTLLRDLSRTDLCQKLAIAYIILPVICILLIAAVATTLFYRYKHGLKTWLFSKNLCLKWITEEDDNNDKIYDAFISYSPQDEDFVVENLLPVLEDESRPYKLCFHSRDWVPGELITRQIIKSVSESKRSLIVLSPDFLDNVWGRLEFRMAHISAMSEEGKARPKVIVVLYGDVDIDKLDDELKSYLKTYTYVKWGDPYFWNKVRYALPHVKRNRKCTHQESIV